MPNLRRRAEDGNAVTSVELFFDLVYVFAITQLSHHLLAEPGVEGAVQTLVLFGMVWLLWVYTTWATNWLDPERAPVRLLLIALMLASLVLSASIPEAFAAHGLTIGVIYAVMQIGRSAFTVFGLPDGGLRRNYQRILCWCAVSGALAVVGGLQHGHAREAWWVAAIGIDLLGGGVGFWTPKLGRSRTEEWDIDGGHIAERCQGFVIIALGESVVVTGTTYSDGTSAVAPFVLAFAGAVLFWWVYFDRSAAKAIRALEQSTDPGRLGRNGFHVVHPIMIAGIIASAAADEKVLQHPWDPAHGSTAALILGGTALFLAGHALFIWAIWDAWSIPRLVAIVLLAGFAPVASHLSAFAVGCCAGAVLLAITVTDRRHYRKNPASAGRTEARTSAEDGGPSLAAS